MQSVIFAGCEGITGTADLGWSEVHIHLIRFGGHSSRTRFLIPHFLLFPLFAFLSAGAVDKIELPEGMQSVNFGYCKGITGTANS